MSECKTQRGWPRIVFRSEVGTNQVNGREAVTLMVLAEKGVVEVFDYPGREGFRLAAYIRNLRKLGLNIEMIRQDHPGGWHGRYRLDSPVEIVQTLWPEPKAGGGVQ